MRRGRALIAALALGVTALSSTLAGAHFRLIMPANVVMQSTDGSPQKTGPCGNEAPQTPSNVVTPFRPGDTVTIQLQETVYHPGHYRVALAVNAPSELPPDPAVTAGTSQCGSTVIQATPVFPILADGMLAHSAPMSGQQSFQVKLPTNVTCTACTLQIIEFMSEHGAPCFYHHCAKISIQDGAADGGTGGTADAGRDAAGGAGGAGGAAGSGATGGGAGSGGSGGIGGTTGGGAGSGPSGGSGGATGGSAGSGPSGGSGGSGATGGGATGGGAGSGATGGIGGSGGAGGSAGTGSGATGGAGGAETGGATGRGGSSVETTGCACSLARADARSWAGAMSFAALALVAVRRRRRPPAP